MIEGVTLRKVGMENTTEQDDTSPVSDNQIVSPGLGKSAEISGLEISGHIAW